MGEPPHGPSPAREPSGWVLRCRCCGVTWQQRGAAVTSTELEGCSFCGAGPSGVYRYQWEGAEKRSRFMHHTW